MLEALREQTKHKHQELEHHMLSNQSLTTESYHKLIAVHWSVLNHLQQCSSFSEGLKKIVNKLFQAIKADADRMNLSMNPGLLSSQYNSEMSLGVEYVLVGSSLGSKFLLRDIASKEELNKLEANHFLTIASELKWKELKHKLEDQKECNEEIVNGAIQCFDDYISTAKAIKTYQ